MLFSRWFRRGRRPTPTFQPTLLVLEDRTLPSSISFFPPPGPATHLQVIVPENVQSGKAFNVLVEAEDASNRLATSYTGAVTLSLGTADPGATLPSSYTFQASDHGEHLFQVTLVATGSQTILASGTLPGTTPAKTITGSAVTMVNPAPVFSQLLVVTPEQAAVGVPTRVTVEALDAAGHMLPSYAGTVTLSTSDTAATGLPATYTFVGSDHGEHTFKVTFETGVAAGTPTTVTASVNSITDQASLTVYPATTVTHFGVFALPVSLLNTPTPVYIEALNASNQVVTGYSDEITLGSSDTAAKASATMSGTPALLSAFSYTFTTSDEGSHLFWVTFGTSGQQSLTVTDTTTKVTSSINIQVINLHFPHK